MYKFISAAPKCLIFGLMMVFLAVGICGCGSQSADTIVDNQQTPEPVTLLLSAAASLTDVMADLEKVYQEEHPIYTRRDEFIGSPASSFHFFNKHQLQFFFSHFSRPPRLIAFHG